MSATVEPELAQIGAFAGDLVVQAGAGTGKTHALVTLYLHLVTGLGARAGALSPANIVVITFTDKAASELRERIRDRLGRLVSEGLSAEPALVAAAQRLAREPVEPAALRRALAELARAPIGTFHTFGQGLLRRHALVAGIDPAARLLEDAEPRELDAARAAVLAGLERKDAAVERLVEIFG